MREIVLAATTSNLVPFWELFFSSFFGIGTALLVEAIWDTHKDKQVRKQLIKNFEAELHRVIETASTLSNRKVYMAPFSIPVWKGAVACGSILSLDNESVFSDLLEAFSSIDEANGIETRCFELTVGNSDEKVNNMVFEVLRDNRQHVIERANHGLLAIKRRRN